jgi:hypothetical protein
MNQIELRRRSTVMDDGRTRLRDQFGDGEERRCYRSTRKVGDGKGA